MKTENRNVHAVFNNLNFDLMSRLLTIVGKTLRSSQKLVSPSILRQSCYRFSGTKQATTVVDRLDDTPVTHTNAIKAQLGEIEEKLDKFGIREKYIKLFVTVLKEQHWERNLTALEQEIVQLKHKQKILENEIGASKTAIDTLTNEIYSVTRIITDIYDSTKNTIILRELTKTLNYMSAVYFSFIRGEVVWSENQAPECMCFLF